MSQSAWERVHKALSELTDPASKQPVNKFVSKFWLDRGTLVLQLAHATSTEVQRRDLEAVLAPLTRVDGVDQLRVRWVEDLPARSVSASDPLPGVKHIVLVMSGKGGVGKSTVCSNLALALKRMGYRVGLLDADMYGPSVPTMLGIHGQPMTDGKAIQPLQRFGVKLMSIGFMLQDPKAAVVWRGPMLHSALLQLLKDVAWGELDYLLLDLPPGTGDVALTLAQNVPATGGVIVTTPQEVALQDVYKSVSMAQKVGIDILGVVENQSYFVCGKCDERHLIFGEGGGAKVAEAASAPLLGQLPIHTPIREWGDAGTPFVQASPGSDVARIFTEIADGLVERSVEVATSRSEVPIDRTGGQNRRLPIAR